MCYIIIYLFYFCLLFNLSKIILFTCRCLTKTYKARKRFARILLKQEYKIKIKLNMTDFNNTTTLSIHVNSVYKSDSDTKIGIT